MKTIPVLLLLASLDLSAGDFVNLTFDEPDLSGSLTPIFSGGPLEGSSSELLRGWRLLLNGSAASTIAVSKHPQTPVQPATVYNNSPEVAASAFGPYSLVLDSNPPNAVEFRLQQTGTVPTDAVGLWISSTGFLQTRINGSKVGEVDPAVGGFPIMDVSAYAGQTVELEFLIQKGNGTRFDILGWVAVPEPETWALLAVGLAALGWQSWRRR